ncbi:MAG: DotU family type IV/VI secretion system protein [Planctomycetales bacterium]|nr:DotU family type IV/VI secretion system protein [Planctomycetales bacterium]
MRPEFAKVIDPIFLATLQFVDRIERGSDRLVPADERATLLRKIDDAELQLGGSEQWLLAKYALCAWIDAMLIDAPWEGKSWWKDNCLEKKYFGRRDAHEAFFQRANDAATLGPKDALEVFYLAVVLGFRGFYGDSDPSYRARLASGLRLPDTVEAWCRSIARSLQLKQGRPPIREAIQTGGSAKPLVGRTTLVMYSMISVILLGAAIAVAILVFSRDSGRRQSPRSLNTHVNWHTSWAQLGSEAYREMGNHFEVARFVVMQTTNKMI